MMRIMIIGGPGAGKTWLGQKLAERLGLPLVHVDDHVWLPDRTLRPAPDIDAALRHLAQGQRWIIEGGNSRTYTIRAARADTIIWLVPGRWLRLARVLRRRPSPALLSWTWKYDHVFGPADRAAVDAAGPETAIHRLPTRRSVQAFLDGLDR